MIKNLLFGLILIILIVVTIALNNRVRDLRCPFYNCKRHNIVDGVQYTTYEMWKKDMKDFVK